LASAYIAGFKYGLKNGYDYVAEMDADFSHPPKIFATVGKLIAESRYDFLVGSRYTEGGSVKNWPFYRRIISRFGSLYARIVLSVSIKDMTGGLNFWSKEVL